MLATARGDRPALLLRGPGRGELAALFALGLGFAPLLFGLAALLPGLEVGELAAPLGLGPPLVYEREQLAEVGAAAYLLQFAE
jgi:hypothetical protein